MKALWNHLVTDNPMSMEGVRAMRRFLRTGGETGRAVNYTLMGILGVLYLWLLLAILFYREEMTTGLLFFEMGLLTLVVPASLYAAVSGEREKLTWDSLIMTRLTPGQIIAGKMLWRVVLIGGIMALFTLPILVDHYASGILCRNTDSCRTPYGYVMSGGDIVRAQGLVFAWSLLLASLSFFASTKSRRPITTLSVLTVALLAFLALIPVLVAIFGGTPFWQPYDFSALSILGSFCIQINPFYWLGMATMNHSDTVDMWRDVGIAPALPYFYVIVAGLFVAGSRRVLRGMEAPRRTIG